MKKLFLALLVVIILAFGWYFYSLRPADASDETRRSVEILSGLSVSDIGWVLQNKGLIRSARAFSIYARMHSSTLQAGDFLLSKSMSTPEIIDALHKGFSQESSVTIPEGLTVAEIDALLTKKGLIEAGAFMDCAKNCDLSAWEFLPKIAKSKEHGGKVEGYLFPDTYIVFTNRFDAKEFLGRMLDVFRKRVITGLADDVKASGRSLSEIVTMGSLIEAETRGEEERPVVAGILWKRLDAKQGLGVDAAVRYGLDKPTGALTVSDLDSNSPYNLRKFRGLPPGPIGNAGLSSIKAALHPTASSYWYYLHDKNGSIHYAETNDEHNRNRALYLN